LYFCKPELLAQLV